MVTGALTLSERFGDVGRYVEASENRVLDEEERHAFARAALALRFDPGVRAGLSSGDPLQPRRYEDGGTDLCCTYNVLQENVLRGGLVRRLPIGRVRRTRKITAIREDVRLNAGLWNSRRGTSRRRSANRFGRVPAGVLPFFLLRGAARAEGLV